MFAVGDVVETTKGSEYQYRVIATFTRVIGFDFLLQRLDWYNSVPFVADSELFQKVEEKFEVEKKYRHLVAENHYMEVVAIRDDVVLGITTKEQQPSGGCWTRQEYRNRWTEVE